MSFQGGQSAWLGDNEGNLVIKANYSEASDFIDGKALVTKGGKEYYIDKEGKKLK